MDIGELVLLLGGVSGVGDQALARILRRMAILRIGPDEFLATSPASLREEYRLPRGVGQAVAALSRAEVDAACALGRELRRHGVQVATVVDASYPRALAAALKDPPAALYFHGAPQLLGARLFCVANSNGAPEMALAATDAVARAAIRCGMAPITGTNRTAYQRPALVARRLGAPVCYVLDRGLLDQFGTHLEVEPVRAARVWQPTVDETRDLTISPFAPRHHAIAAHNRRRDEIVFALASVVIAGYVRPGGVMDRLCREALGSGRPVTLVCAGSPSADGLARAGAIVLDPIDEDAVAAALLAAATAPI